MPLDSGAFRNWVKACVALAHHGIIDPESSNITYMSSGRCSAWYLSPPHVMGPASVAPLPGSMTPPPPPDPPTPPDDPPEPTVDPPAPPVPEVVPSLPPLPLPPEPVFAPGRVPSSALEHAVTIAPTDAQTARRERQTVLMFFFRMALTS